MIAFIPFLFALIPLLLFTVRLGISTGSAARIGLRTACVATVFFAFFVVYLLFRTGSPMWALGLIMVPVLAAEYFAIVLMVCWSTLYSIAAIRSRAMFNKTALQVEALAIIALVGVVMYAAIEWRVMRVNSVAPHIGELSAIYRNHMGDRHVAAVLATREITPREILRAIGTNPPATFRTRPSSYRDLLRNDEVSVLVHLARNRNTPPEILARLAVDTMPEVAAAAAANSGTPAVALANAGAGAAIGLSGNPQTPPERLGELSLNRSTGVRERVASNPSTPPNELEKLTADSNIMVRLHLVYNPSLSLRGLKVLAADSNRTVSRSALAQIELRTKRSALATAGD
jgi:hypothetical protein